MSESSRRASQDALHKVDAMLKSAKNNIAQVDERGQTREYLVEAYSTCDEIGGGLGSSLKPLIDNAIKSVDENRPTETITIDIDGALAEVENIRPGLFY